MSVTLGLDLGPNSIGWALIDETNHRIIALGSRIFPEGVDNFDTSKEVSRNETRRTARGMRRQIARRARRKRLLREALIQAGLYASDPAQQEALTMADPYQLRARAVDPNSPALSPYEMGRVLLHLNQRRGFLSNRKTDRGDAELKGMLAEIEGLASEIGERTLGQYLHDKVCAFDHANRTETDHVRHRHTQRMMLENEFNAIWECQSKHWPDLLTDELKFGTSGRCTYPSKPARCVKGSSILQTFGLHGMIFFQRPMYWPKSMIGLCELEPKQPRCPRADRRAQRFRLWQELNNLKFIDPDQNNERKLSAEQRQIVFEKLATQESLTFDKLRDALGFLDAVRFNLERGKRTKLQGMVTDWMMAKAVGKLWHKRTAGEKDTIVEILLNNQRDDEAIHERFVNEFGMTTAEADAALEVDVPSGYMMVSLVAINKLLPHLERGLVYMDDDESNSAMHAAGYMREDQLQRRIFDCLPDPARTINSPIGDIPNPVVRRSLVELRKLINSIIREFGRPDDIHIEMGRDLKTRPKPGSPGFKKYMDNLNEMREREANRDLAATKLRENGTKVTRDGINQYLLWQQQNQDCPYCGKKISSTQFFSGSGDVDVDHILPYSRCLDDSQMNKVVCHRRCNSGNHGKGQRTPHEWLADSQPKKYEEVCQRAKKLPYDKYRRFIQKELELDKFIARQLNDTRYFATATAAFLRCLYDPEDRKRGAVLGLKGQLTAELRHQWGVNDILNSDGVDVKSRNDHRHHAVDAVIIALTNRSRLKKLTKIRKSGGVRETGKALEHPWDGFRNELVERVNAINVSHRPERKVAGGLHDEKPLGPTENPGVFVIRKSLEILSPNEVELIRDEPVRHAIAERLKECGVDIGRGNKATPAVWKKALCDPANPVRVPPSKRRLKREPNAIGIPVHKVRVLRNEQTIQPIRKDSPGSVFVKPGSTHHMSIFEYEEDVRTVRDTVFTTMLEAMDRLKRQNQLLKAAKVELQQKISRRICENDPILAAEMRRIAQQIPLITRVHPDRPEARFLYSLSRGEAVLADVKGKQELLIYNTAASTTQQMVFFHHADARPKTHKEKDKQRKKITFKPATLNARKVTLDPIGRIRWAND